MFFLHSKNQNSRGFSFVEALVVMAIISAFLLVVSFNIPKIKQQYAVSRVANKFSQDMKRAQNLASSSAQHYAGGNPVVGYGVYVSAQPGSNKSYKIYGDAQTGTTTQNGIQFPYGNQHYDTADYVVETVDLNSTEPGIHVKSVSIPTTNSASFNYNIADSKFTIFRIQTADTYTVDVTFGSEAYAGVIRTVTVNFSGATSIK